MDSETKIRELEERILKLEKAEQKRIIKRRIHIILKIVEIIVIIGLLFFAYTYVNNKYIKPLSEKINYVEDKVGSVEGFIDDKLGALQKFNIFN